MGSEGQCQPSGRALLSGYGGALTAPTKVASAGSPDRLSNYRKLGTLPQCTGYYEEDKCELNHEKDSDWGHCNRMEFGEACHVGWRCAFIRGFSEGQCQPSGRALLSGNGGALTAPTKVASAGSPDRLSNYRKLGTLPQCTGY